MPCRCSSVVCNKSMINRCQALWLAFMSGLSMASAGGGAISTEETVRLVRQDCGSCHGMTLQGGLGTPLTKDALAGQSAEALTIIILHGKHGTAMPPWKSLLSEQQARWIAERLLEGFPEEIRQ